MNGRAQTLPAEPKLPVNSVPGSDPQSSAAGTLPLSDGECARDALRRFFPGTVAAIEAGRL